MSNAGLVLQLLTRGDGDANHIDQQCVIGAAGTRVFDGDEAMNAVPFAHENQCKALADSGRSIVADGDRVAIVGHAPALGPKRWGKSQDVKKEYEAKYDSRQLGCSLSALIASGEKFAHAQNFTATGSRSVSGTSKNWRCWNPNMPAIKFVGKDWFLVFSS